MKKLLLFFILFLSIITGFSQQSLDSLRFVLPVGHTKNVKTAVFSPDGKLILTASGDNTSRIYEVLSGKELQVLLGHRSWLNSAVFSPDGNLVLTASNDSTARVYEVYTGKELHVLTGNNGEVKSAIFSPDGKKILTTSSDTTARIYDVDSGVELHILRGHSSWLNSAVFSPDGNMVLTAGNDSTARIYDLSTGKEMNVYYEKIGTVNIAVFSPDGKLILTAGEIMAKIYEVDTGKELQILASHTANINSAVFSPDGKLVLTASDDFTARIYDVFTGKEIKVLLGHTEHILSANFSLDGKTVLTSEDYSSDGFGNTARIYEVSTGNEIHAVDGNFAIFSPEGKRFLVLNGMVVHIFDVKSGKELQVLKGYCDGITTAIFSLNGELVLTSNYTTALIYSIKSGEVLQVLKGHRSTITSAIFSPDGKLVLTASWDATARIYEVATGNELQIFKGHSGEVASAIFSPDGKLVLTSGGLSIGDDNTARIYEASSGKELQVLTGHTSALYSAVFSPDGKLVLTASWDATARIFDVSIGKELHVLSGSCCNVSSAVFSPDIKLAITAGSENACRIYDVSSGTELQYLEGYDHVPANISPDGEFVLTSNYSTAQIYSLAARGIFHILKGGSGRINSAIFSPNGKLVLTTTDLTAQIYSVNTGNLLHVLIGHIGEITNAIFSPNGKLVLTTSSDNITILWDVETGKPIHERIQLENNKWLIKRPNSPYYMCSKDASKLLHYVTPSLKVIGFEQLDPVYNRPDIVLDSIGKFLGGSDGGMIDEYRKSWEKRIDRLGLDKEKLGKGEISVPNAEIIGADEIIYENKNGKLEIKVAANDPKYPLRRFNVYINEVPLYGSAGISIAHLKKQVWDTTVSVPLSMGENKIQVSVMNELGLENFKYPTYVNYSPQKELVAKTYFIGIGVNEFMEKEHNLKYCVKDVQDLAMAFADGKSNVDTLLLTNKEVTRENILKLKEFLSKTSVNDKVIISCSSHGLLDDSLNFYLAMYDMDFKNPKARGLKYEELESILDGIPARQKLLLLDACNSGENDKTEVLKKELEQKQVKMNITEVLAARGAIVKLEEENKSNFKKMNELFVNVRNNTGSVIISAAGGQESALEAIKVDGETIENGAFTFSVLEYLNSNKTNSEALTVNKLKQYAEKRVEEITNGKQRPTSRQETMEIDWGVSN